VIIDKSFYVGPTTRCRYQQHSNRESGDRVISKRLQRQRICFITFLMAHMWAGRASQVLVIRSKLLSLYCSVVINNLNDGFILLPYSSSQSPKATLVDLLLLHSPEVERNFGTRRIAEICPDPQFGLCAWIRVSGMIRPDSAEHWAGH
jgi:hypothetical protein